MKRAADLPEQFFPASVEPPDFEFLNALEAEKRVDGRQFMRSTVAVWRVAGDREPQDVVALVRQSLADTGWNVPEENNEGACLRTTDGRQDAGQRHSATVVEIPGARREASLAERVLLHRQQAFAISRDNQQFPLVRGWRLG
jgi:hypothetical protein